MKCPYCEKEFPVVSCPACHEESPEGAVFCMRCGAVLASETPVVEESEDLDLDLDFDDRILCPDGTCTGIIVAGKCSECGRPYVPGSEPAEESGEEGPGEDAPDRGEGGRESGGV